MPSLRILSNVLPKETKLIVAKQLTTDVKVVLMVPIVEVFFNEYDNFFVNGEETKKGFITIIIEGPNVNDEKLAQLCSLLSKDLKLYTNQPECNISFVYHHNDHKHVGINGKLLSDRNL